MSKKTAFFVVLCTLTFGVLIGYCVRNFQTPQPLLQSFGKQIREGKGVYTNPLLECDVASGTINVPKNSFETELKEFVSSVESREAIFDVAVYYRDLNNGPTFGVNQDEKFFPASLLKVPAMMAFMKHAESDPSILLKNIEFTSEKQNKVAEQTIKPQEQLEIGKTYTVEDLIDRMIRYSDNNSLGLLFPLIPESEYLTLFANLGFSETELKNSAFTLSVKEYATFFRILFNASYLSQKNSEYALEIMTRSGFTDGLRAGVPSKIAVAHKFGEHDLADGNYQFHDCGIIYIPQQPYLLCVMTRGTKQTELIKAIRDITEFTYTKKTQPR